MRLDAQLETGINYRDYRALVGDANLELKLYAATKGGVQHPQAVANFRSALLQHELAGTLWQRKLQGGSWAWIQPGEPMYQGLVTSYPAATKELQDGGATSPSGRLDIEFLLPLIWERASKLSNQGISSM